MLDRFQCDDAQPPDDAECPADGGSDECTCGGVACADGTRCRRLEVRCSCGPTSYYECVEEACETERDCEAGTACIPSFLIVSERCVVSLCVRDEQCTAGAAGRCALLVDPPVQQGSPDANGVTCVYRSAPDLLDLTDDPSLCRGTPAQYLLPVDASESKPGIYNYCPYLNDGQE